MKSTLGQPRYAPGSARDVGCANEAERQPYQDDTCTRLLSRGWSHARLRPPRAPKGTMTHRPPQTAANPYFPPPGDPKAASMWYQ